MSDTSQDIVEIDYNYLAENDTGVLVETEYQEEGVWLPKSEIRNEDKDFTRQNVILIPEWLAINAGLV